MSIKYKLENAFRYVVENGLAEDSPIQVITSLENQNTTIRDRRLVINALNGVAVTPKSRTLRYRVELMYESSADVEARIEGDPEPPDPATVFREDVETIHRILEENAQTLAERLSEARAEVGAFTCFLVSLIGELESLAQPAQRVFQDRWGYMCTVAEQDST